MPATIFFCRGPGPLLQNTCGLILRSLYKSTQYRSTHAVTKP
jgi:hypothetical protein